MLPGINGWTDFIRHGTGQVMFMTLTTVYRNGFVKETFKKLEQIPNQIRWFGDPVLRQISLPFSDNEIAAGEAQEVADQLVRTLKQIREKLGIGKGLAAPQIGILKRIFVKYNLNTNNFSVFINPIITAVSEEKGVFNETCLSGLPLSGKVVRPWQVDLEYYDVEGQIQKVTADPISSRVAQHEIDHLDGILFIDQLGTQSLSFVFNWEDFIEQNKLVKIS